MKTAFRLLDRGIVPDPLIRHGIRRLLQGRLQAIRASSTEAQSREIELLREQMSTGPLAVHTDTANEQHYELPADFMQLVLGPRRKYSSCFWSPGCESLEQAEDDSLRLSCEHADLVDGQSILELGCGWGSLSLWLAEHYPNSRITSVSNSASQRRLIESIRDLKGFQNLEVITSDINDFSTDKTFDRVVSIEMFEHMRNWDLLFARISRWLRPGGKLFFHIFCHRTTPYFFEVDDESDWLARYFFTGGVMPSESLPLYFQRHLEVEEHWSWSGLHYSRTAEAWIRQLDRNKPRVLDIFRKTYGEPDANRWLNRWRAFFLAVSELFAYGGGDEWLVTHYRFQKRQRGEETP